MHVITNYTTTERNPSSTRKDKTINLKPFNRCVICNIIIHVYIHTYNIHTYIHSYIKHTYIHTSYIHHTMPDIVNVDIEFCIEGLKQ